MTNSEKVTQLLQEIGSFPSLTLICWSKTALSSAGENWHTACQFAQWRLGDPWFTAESCNTSCKAYSNCCWMLSSREMYNIFSSLVYTVKGTEKKYLKHQEVKSKGLGCVGWEGVVYFLLVRLEENESPIYRRCCNDLGAECACTFPSG